MTRSERLSYERADTYSPRRENNFAGTTSMHFEITYFHNASFRATGYSRANIFINMPDGLLYGRML